MTRPVWLFSGRRFSTAGANLCVAVLLAWATCGCSCEEEESKPKEKEEVRDPVTGLTALEADEVLAQVGEKKITLGDYVATLLRMDRFERLRYQTEQRQKLLLDEMIQVELLAQEARRRGLHQDPEVQLRLQQALRDELLRQVEAELPPPEEFSEREVRNYYDAHRDEFKEPERRRVLMIRVGAKSRAEELLEKAKGASGDLWAKLADQYALDRKAFLKGAPELAGDTGFVSAPGEERGQNESIPEPVRAAIFEVEEVGEVVPRVVEAEGSFYVVRLGGVSPVRDRTVAEADRGIRVELRRLKFLAAEKKLEAELRKKYPVVIDEKALAAQSGKASESEPDPDPQP